MGALIVSQSAHQTRTQLMVVRFRLRRVSKEDDRTYVGLSQCARAKRCRVPGDKTRVDSTRRKSGSQIKSQSEGELSAEVCPLCRVLVRITLCIDDPSAPTSRGQSPIRRLQIPKAGSVWSSQAEAS